MFLIASSGIINTGGIAAASLPVSILPDPRTYYVALQDSEQLEVSGKPIGTIAAKAPMYFLATAVNPKTGAVRSRRQFKLLAPGSATALLKFKAKKGDFVTMQFSSVPFGSGLPPVGIDVISAVEIWARFFDENKCWSGIADGWKDPDC